MTGTTLNDIKRKKIKIDKKDWRRPSLKSLIILLTLINTLAVILVVSALFLRTSPENIVNLVNSSKVTNAIGISLISIFISLCTVTMLGIPIAYGLSMGKFSGKSLLEGLFTIPIVLPPSVTGLALLMTFGRRGIVGMWLNKIGLSLTFSFAAIVIVQVFVTLPYFIQIVKNSFSNIDKSMAEAARTFGASEWDVLRSVYIPMSFKAILSALILCAFRAAGEFGATIMFAGNLEGSTQTVTTRIYTLYQMDLSQSVSLAVLQIALFILPLMLIKIKLD